LLFFFAVLLPFVVNKKLIIASCNKLAITFRNQTVDEKAIAKLQVR